MSTTGPNLCGVLAMNGWDEGHPAWWLNLEANPDAEVRLAKERSPGRSIRDVLRVPSVIARGSSGSAVEPPLQEDYAGGRSTETPVVVFEPVDGAS